MLCVSQEPHYELSRVAHVCHLSTCEGEVGRSGVQGQPQLCSKLEASLVYMRSSERSDSPGFVVPPEEPKEATQTLKVHPGLVF